MGVLPPTWGVTHTAVGEGFVKIRLYMGCTGRLRPHFAHNLQFWGPNLKNFLIWGYYRHVIEYCSYTLTELYEQEETRLVSRMCE